jgi:hypothetical protein
MIKFKTMLLLTLFTMGFVVSNMAEAVKVDPVKTGPVGPAGPKGPAGPTASYLTPIYVDANGVYVGTLLSRGINIDMFSNLPINSLVLKKGYVFGLNSNGEFKPFIFDGYENDTCSGPPTLLRSGIAIPLTQEVFKKGYVLDASIGYIFSNLLVDPELYYIPKQDGYYQSQVYAYVFDGVAYNCLTAESASPINLSVAGSKFYKPILNDPAVTGVDPTYINSLKKPFNISIDY